MHAGLAKPLDLNCITAGPIGGTTCDGQCSKHVEAALVGKLARTFNLADDVIGPQRGNRDRYL